MPLLVRKKVDGTVIERVEVTANPVVFGRGGDAAVKVLDDRMSRQHFVVAPRDNTFIIQDLKSTNGTWVNGQRVEETVLKPNDRIRAGATVWVFEEKESKGLATMMGELEQEKKGFKTLLGDISREAEGGTPAPTG